MPAASGSRCGRNAVSRREERAAAAVCAAVVVPAINTENAPHRSAAASSARAVADATSTAVFWPPTSARSVTNAASRLAAVAPRLVTGIRVQPPVRL